MWHLGSRPSLPGWCPCHDMRDMALFSLPKFSSPLPADERASGGTRLHDAIKFAIDELVKSKHEQRDMIKQVVVLSDGGDNCSSTTSDELVEIIKKPGVSHFHIIGVGIAAADCTFSLFEVPNDSSSLCLCKLFSKGVLLPPHMTPLHHAGNEGQCSPRFVHLRRGSQDEGLLPQARQNDQKGGGYHGVS